MCRVIGQASVTALAWLQTDIKSMSFMPFKNDVNFESAFRPFIIVQVSSVDFSDKVNFHYTEKLKWFPDIKSS